MNGLSVDDKCVPEKAADLDIKDSAVGNGVPGGTITSPQILVRIGTKPSPLKENPTRFGDLTMPLRALMNCKAVRDFLKTRNEKQLYRTRGPNPFRSRPICIFHRDVLMLA